jgi:hypothetical protein
MNIDRSIKGKGRIHPKTGHEVPDGRYTYSNSLALSLAVGEGGWSTPHFGRFIPEKRDPVPIIQKAGWAPGPVERSAGNFTPSPVLDPRTFQPVTIRYTDYAIPAHFIWSIYTHIKTLFF